MKAGRICCVIGAGELYASIPNPNIGDLVIAVDGGYAYLQHCGIEADIVVGDFDSLPERPDHPDTIELNKEKDETDMLVALKLGLRKGYSIFHIYGGTGGRFDHTFANIQCLAFLSKNKARGFLFGDKTVITAIHNSEIIFDSNYDGYISVFAHSGIARGVYIKGLKYELENAELSDAIPIGVSNEYIGIGSSISVKDGTLVVIYPKNTGGDVL